MIHDGSSADKIAFRIGDIPETIRRVYAQETSSKPAASGDDAALSGLV